MSDRLSDLVAKWISKSEFLHYLSQADDNYLDGQKSPHGLLWYHTQKTIHNIIIYCWESSLSLSSTREVAAENGTPWNMNALVCSQK